MNIIEIENKKIILDENLSSTSSFRLKPLLIYEFFQHLLNITETNLKEAYLLEYLNEYLNSLHYFDPFCIHPDYSKQLIEQLQVLVKIEFLEKYKEKIIQLKDKIESKLNQLNEILNGNNSITSGKNRSYFPVLEKNNFIEGICLGNLETITVKIEKAKDENNFIIVPRERELEERIEEQIKNSWIAAINFCKSFIKKINPHHKIFIHFDKMHGVYIGKSFGIVLTLEFIEELLKLYNAPTIVRIKENISFTGGIDKTGNIEETTKEIIQNKMETIFFSPIETFVLHKNDEAAALVKVNELKEEFSKRSINIVSVTSLNDLINRRNLVDIRKQNPVVRAGKTAKKNILTLTLTVLLAAIIIFSGLWDFDDNPALFENTGQLLLVKNNNGKVLWTKEMDFNPALLNGDKRKVSQKIVDINNDGINEILLCNENLDKNKLGRIACFNRNQELIWEYYFKDTVSTFRSWTTGHQISIIDTATIEGNELLLLIACNYLNFPSAIFKLNLQTGQRVDSINTFWHAGALIHGIMGDFNKDKRVEIVCTAIHNGFERSVVFSINIDKLFGQAPSPGRYIFNRLPLADLNEYVLLPKTDHVARLFRYNIPFEGSLSYIPDSNEFVFLINEGHDHSACLNYGFTNNLRFSWVDCADDLQMKRDSLVAKGILNPPYTNTTEYFNLLKDQIRYWDGEKFVKNFPQ